VLLGLLLLSVAGPSLAEWDVGRGGPTRTGRSEVRPFVRANVLESWIEKGLGGNHLGSPVVAELDGQKVIFVGSRDNNLYAINSDGSSRWAYQTGGSVYSTPAVGDINGDGKLEVVFSSLDGWLYAVSAENGSLVWKFNMGKASQAAPLIYDVNSDGKNEVVFNLGYPSTIYELRPYVYALRGDNGVVLWTISIDGNVFSAPSAADVDNDGEVEVVFGSVNGKVYVVRGENGEIKWSRKVGRIYSTVPIADLDNDGQLDLVVCTWDNGIHALRASDGEPLWWVSSISYVQTDPAVGDIDGDGVLEVVVPSRPGWVYCLRGEDGSLMWSFEANNEMLSSPILADVNGDGILNVVFGTDSARIAGKEGENGRLYILKGSDNSVVWSYLGEECFRSEPAIVQNYDGCVLILATEYRTSFVRVFRVTGRTP
jgi:outer membrane protein assembly factor BamB